MPDFKPTEEQMAIVNAPGRVICANAFAGTGKSSTMRLYAKEHPEEKILYVAFNRSVAVDARRKMPRNVTCTTGHAIAYKVFGEQFRSKLAGDLRPFDLVLNNWIDFPRAINETGKYIFADGVVRIINRFLQSSLDSMDDFDLLKLKSEVLNQSHYGFHVSDMVEQAKRVWRSMCDVESPIPQLHDGYLKLYQLTAPELHEFDTIMLDEAQDSNPALLSIIMRQSHAKIILIGDKHQNIYSYRGSMNAMAAVKADTVCTLSGSFRFGPSVAKLSNNILGKWKGEKTPVRGLGPPTVVYPEMVVPLKKGYAYVARTNATVFQRAANAVERGLRPYFLGGIAGYRLYDINDAYFLSRGKEINNPKFKVFSDWGNMVAMAETIEDVELLSIISTVKRYGWRIPDMVKKIHKMEAKKIKDADIILCTAHKSKGLEFSKGCVENDFKELGEDGTTPSDDEINLMYVAVTRFQNQVHIPPNVVFSAYGNKI